MNINPYLLFAFIMIALPCASVAEQSATSQKASLEQCTALNKASTERCTALNKASSKQSTVTQKANAEACAASQKANAEACAASQKANAEACAASQKTVISSISDTIYSYLTKALQVLPSVAKLDQEQAIQQRIKQPQLGRLSEWDNFIWEGTKNSIGNILELWPTTGSFGFLGYLGVASPLLEVTKAGNTLDKVQSSAQSFKTQNIQLVDELYANRQSVRNILDLEAKNQFGVFWWQLTEKQKNQLIEYSGGWDEFLIYIGSGYASGIILPKVRLDALPK